MENRKKASDRFRDAHIDLVGPGTKYATGYGLDPARKGPMGVLVYAMSDDVREQGSLLQAARTSLPTTWEGYPVYLQARSIPSKRR